MQVRQSTVFTGINFKFEYDFISNLKLFILESKYPKSWRFYLNTNRQVERLSEIISMVVVRISLQCFMLPKCMVSFAVYFFTDSGSDSFELPFPLW